MFLQRTWKVRVMRDTFHAELHELMAGLARLARLAGQMMTNASIALHQTDLPLAGLVIANRDHMGTMLDNTERRCITLLALQAPVAGDLRMVVAALHAVRHLQRMGNLARASWPRSRPGRRRMPRARRSPRLRSR